VCCKMFCCRNGTLGILLQFSNVAKKVTWAAKKSLKALDDSAVIILKAKESVSHLHEFYLLQLGIVSIFLFKEGIRFGDIVFN
jgi:hypothetical protein